MCKIGCGKLSPMGEDMTIKLFLPRESLIVFPNCKTDRQCGAINGLTVCTTASSYDSHTCSIGGNIFRVSYFWLLSNEYDLERKH